MFIRLVARFIDNGTEVDGEILVIQTRLEGNKLSSKLQGFGYLESNEDGRKSKTPFVLDMNSRESYACLDYGSEFEMDRINLKQRELAVGNLFTLYFSENSEEYTYRIVSILEV